MQAMSDGINWSQSLAGVLSHLDSLLVSLQMLSGNAAVVAVISAQLRPQL